MARAMHLTSLVRRTVAPLAIALLVSLASVSCSAGPPGRTPPVLVDGPAQPEPGAGGSGIAGAGGVSGDPDAGPDDDAAGAAEAVPVCTALAQCCSRFAIEDPAQGWCQESLVQAASPDECGRLLTFWGC